VLQLDREFFFFKKNKQRLVLLHADYIVCWDLGREEEGEDWRSGVGMQANSSIYI
jgi:hypothetical protein